MAGRGVGSSLRRKGAPLGALTLVGLVLALPARAATPAPDPPPSAVVPDPPAAAEPAPPPVTRAPAPTPRTPVVRAAVVPAPVAKPTRARGATPPAPKTTPALPARAARPAPEPVVRAPHDRHPVPLVALLVPGGELDRGLLAVAGVALLLVTLGGTVVLAVARRELAA